jgi:hypothetical protein
VLLAMIRIPACCSHFGRIVVDGEQRLRTLRSGSQVAAPWLATVLPCASQLPAGASRLRQMSNLPRVPMNWSVH